VPVEVIEGIGKEAHASKKDTYYAHYDLEAQAFIKRVSFSHLL